MLTFGHYSVSIARLGYMYLTMCSDYLIRGSAETHCRRTNRVTGKVIMRDGNYARKENETVTSVSSFLNPFHRSNLQ